MSVQMNNAEINEATGGASSWNAINRAVEFNAEAIHNLYKMYE